MEKDPNGKSLNEAGAKADYGKTRLALVLGSFYPALNYIESLKDTPNELILIQGSDLRREIINCRLTQTDQWIRGQRLNAVHLSAKIAQATILRLACALASPSIKVGTCKKEAIESCSGAIETVKQNLTVSQSHLSKAMFAEIEQSGILAHLSKMDSAILKAFWAIAIVGSDGAAKYTPMGWMSVPDGIMRYKDAELRHLYKEDIEGLFDLDSMTLHCAHAAWNSLAALTLELKELNN